MLAIRGVRHKPPVAVASFDADTVPASGSRVEGVHAENDFYEQHTGFTDMKTVTDGLQRASRMHDQHT